MKSLLQFLLLSAIAPAALFAVATVGSPALVHLSDMDGKAMPLLREALDSGGPTGGGKPYLIPIDTNAVDTGLVHFDVLSGQIISITDTLGSASFTCKDFSGTDTIALVLKWQGNTRTDGKGVWRNIDSLELKDLGASGAAAQGVYRDTSKAVVNTGGYARLRFLLRNKLGSNANRKAVCKDAELIRRKRALYR